MGLVVDPSELFEFILQIPFVEDGEPTAFSAVSLHSDFKCVGIYPAHSRNVQVVALTHVELVFLVRYRPQHARADINSML